MTETARPPDEPPVRVLVVDDEPPMRRTIARVLAQRGFEVHTADGGAAGILALETLAPDVALVDMMMPDVSGLDVLARAKEKRLAVEIIMMTAFADVEAAVGAVKSGAYHFLTKPFTSNEAVALTVAKAAERKRLTLRAHELEERLVARDAFGGMLGASPKMQAVYRLIEGVASTTSTVLILGESGTGKELAARAIHQRSPRAKRPFVPVNCAAIPKDLVESELFGHVKGAFSGAHQSRAGVFEAASTGTLFLDEVGDLPLAAQVKLLRALQEGEIRPVGADDARHVDVRVIAATNVDLSQKIDAGEFRRDLYYRLNVINVSLPPLRERAGDITELAHHFLTSCAARFSRNVSRFSPDALACLEAYRWPGNVRELEHAVERAVVLARGGAIDVTDLPDEVSARASRVSRRPSRPSIAPNVAAGLADLPYPEAKRRAGARFDEAYVKALLADARGNVSEAARHAGLDRSNFRRLLRRAKATGSERQSTPPRKIPAQKARGAGEADKGAKRGKRGNGGAG